MSWNFYIEAPNFTKIQFGGLQWMHSGLEIVNFLQKLSIFDKLQQFLSNLLPSYSVFNQFWFLKRIFLYVIIKGLWSCYLRMAFRDGDNFCKAFAGALVNLSYHEWLESKQSKWKWQHFWEKWGLRNCLLKMNGL